MARLLSLVQKNSFREVGIYTITAALSKAISFAALPFFVNFLSEGDIGILNIFGASVTFLTPIVSMGVLYTISVDYFTLSKKEYARVFSSSLVIPLVFCLLMLPLLYFFRQPLENAFNFQYDFFWLIPISLLVNFSFEAFVILIRNQHQVKLFTFVSFLKIVLEIGFSISLIVWVYPNWYSRALAFVIAGAVITGLFFYHIAKYRFLVKTINFQVLAKEFSFGFTGLLLQTAIFFASLSDKFFVMSFFGKEQAGFYSVAATFATIQFIICSSLLQYLQPVLFKQFAALKTWKDLKSLYVKYFAAMLVTLIGIALFTVGAYTWLIKNTYKDYLHYFYLLGISSFIWTITNIFLQYIVFSKRKKIIFVFSLATILLSLLVNTVSSVYLSINWLCFGQIIINLMVLLMVLYFNKRLNYFR